MRISLRFPGRRLLVCAALLLAPFSFDAATGVQPSPAACQDGTCCPEPGSTCIIGNYQRGDKYARLGGGSCSEPAPVRPGT